MIQRVATAALREKDKAQMNRARAEEVGRLIESMTMPGAWCNMIEIIDHFDDNATVEARFVVPPDKRGRLAIITDQDATNETILASVAESLRKWTRGRSLIPMDEEAQRHRAWFEAERKASGLD